MRILQMVLTFVMLVVLPCMVSAKTVEEYIGEAAAMQERGDLADAVALLEDALAEHPDNATIHGYLGGYLIMQIDADTDQGEQGRLFFASIEHLDRAVELDQNDLVARFYRGVTGVQAPEFLNRLEQGVEDLAVFVDSYNTAPDIMPEVMLLTALDMLGTGYDKLHDANSAYETWAKILAIAPGTPLAEDIEQRLMNYLTSAEQVEQTEQTLVDTNPRIAELTERLEHDPENAELVYELAMAYGDEADKGYDERVYGDTTFRTNLAFKVVDLLDRAVRLAPDNMTYRLASGSSSVSMPFFVNRLDRGMEDLQMVIDRSGSDAEKAEAHFWLGYAYQKKATTEWITVATDFAGEEAAAMMFDWITPPVREFDRSDHPGPVVAIDFVLGFRDELAPQTAVWVEDEDGAFVRTVYVSGFSGAAKEKQVNLVRWAQASEYVDADAVTEASIDLGTHCYVWDLNDYRGDTVDPGQYTVKVETIYWPSMKSQSESAVVTIGGEENCSRCQNGRYIPELAVTYYP